MTLYDAWQTMQVACATNWVIVRNQLLILKEWSMLINPTIFINPLIPTGTSVIIFKKMYT